LLRGADHRAEDRTLAEALGPDLDRPAPIEASTGAHGDTPTAPPERAAAHARHAGPPLIVDLDGPQEKPTILAHPHADWTTSTQTRPPAHPDANAPPCRTGPSSSASPATSGSRRSSPTGSPTGPRPP
ncbi:hypothetical protein PUR59_23555, partial [Streptomyces sp. SP18ES09]|uniref:hypothetical protein n=1 Tax=Streptomyces sp. SP18ES09 TaxID=3002532 RepID=UPI002E775337